RRLDERLVGRGRGGAGERRQRLDQRVVRGRRQGVELDERLIRLGGRRGGLDERLVRRAVGQRRRLAQRLVGRRGDDIGQRLDERLVGGGGGRRRGDGRAVRRLHERLVGR